MVKYVILLIRTIYNSLSKLCKKLKPPLSNQVEIFKSAFKGREDVFAIRWENGNKNGYMPAVLYDPYFNRTHRMKQNNEDKTYLPLTNQEIEKHLKGEQLIGVYPLLKDNTTWFLAADFDKNNWIEECLAFIRACSKQGIISYLERSRSGKGGHMYGYFLNTLILQLEAEKFSFPSWNKRVSFLYSIKIPVSIDCFRIKIFFQEKGLAI